MNIFLNNERTEAEETDNLNSLLKKLNLSATKGVAIAINNEVIPKAEWDNVFLRKDDKVTLIKATQGG